MADGSAQATVGASATVSILCGRVRRVKASGIASPIFSGAGSGLPASASFRAFASRPSRSSYHFTTPAYRFTVQSSAYGLLSASQSFWNWRSKVSYASRLARTRDSILARRFSASCCGAPYASV